MNEWRANAAGEALQRFIEIAGGDIDHEREDLVGDLLCDFGHYCDAHGLDWEKLVKRARANIAHERKHPND